MIASQTTLLGRTEVAEETMSFHFEKPRHSLFKAGQYIELTLLHSEPGSSNGVTHTFSIATSPFAEELDWGIMVALGPGMAAEEALLRW